MNLDDLHAVIESAKSRGTDSLHAFIRARRPEATDAEVEDYVARGVLIVESIPGLLGEASEAVLQGRGGLPAAVGLHHAAKYFVTPIDLIPEMTSGLAGLLDDAFLSLVILERLEDHGLEMVTEDLVEARAFLEDLLGDDLSRKLRVSAGIAVDAAADGAVYVDDGKRHEA